MQHLSQLWQRIEAATRIRQASRVVVVDSEGNTTDSIAQAAIIHQVCLEQPAQEEYRMDE